MIARLNRLLFRLRTRRAALELDIALAVRRRHRADRQASARKAANTRFQHQHEGLRR